VWRRRNPEYAATVCGPSMRLRERLLKAPAILGFGPLAYYGVPPDRSRKGNEGQSLTSNWRLSATAIERSISRSYDRSGSQSSSM
jgi:hypothetical protein